MSASLLLEMERQGVQAKIRAFSGDRTISMRDARELIEHGIEATKALRFTWEYPRRALGESGLEAADFKEVCQKSVSILDAHLTLLDLIRRTAEAAASNEGQAVPKLADLDRADAQVRDARRKIEDLLALASRPRGTGIDWGKVRDGEEAIARGEVVRLNPNVPMGKTTAG